MKILCFGSINQDLVYRTEHLVKPGETVSSISVEKNLGGKGANQAMALRKAGLPVIMAGNIGRDGGELLEELGKFGVDVGMVRKTEGLTGNAVIQVDDAGENSIILFPGANHSVDRAQIESVFEDFGRGDWLILQNEINMLPEIMEKAHEKEMRICFNPAPFTRSVLSYPLGYCDILVVNETEASSLSGIAYDGNADEILSDLSMKYPGSDLIMTLGDRGAAMRLAETFVTVMQPAYRTDVKDTTGAGDAFIGYYLASRARKTDKREALRIAAEAASITVSRNGAAVSIPTAEEVFGR